MNDDQFNAITRLADENGIEATPRLDYSGRGMFGATTKGVTLDSHYDADELIQLLAIDTGESVRLKRDSMGKGVILY